MFSKGLFCSVIKACNYVVKVHPFLKQALVFMSLQYKFSKSLKAISPFPQCFFYSFRELAAIFIKSEIVVCKLFQLEESKICHLGKG